MNIIKSLILTIITILLIFLFASLFNSCAEAKDFHVLELDELTLDYKNFAMINDKARNMLIYPEHPKEGINVIINMNLFKYAYWNSTIESLTTSSQYKSIGLDTRLGVRLFPVMDVGIYHHSQHVLDGKHSYMNGFPEEDAVEIKLYIYKQNRESSLFGDLFK